MTRHHTFKPLTSDYRKLPTFGKSIGGFADKPQMLIIGALEHCTIVTVTVTDRRLGWQSG